MMTEASSIERLIRERDEARDEAAHADMASGALAAIHDILDSCGIPRGTFADDHARNAVVALKEARAECERLREALAGLFDLCLNANAGAWRNGVTDATGTIDEGEVHASDYLDRARAALAQGGE